MKWWIRGILGIAVFCLLLLLWVLFWMPIPDVFFDDQYQGPTKMYDRSGQLLYEVQPPQKGRTYYLTLDRMPELAKQGTILLEDQQYYRHHGVDVGAVLRAIWTNAHYGRVTSGASTIPQQLVRNMLGTDRERTLEAKIYESLVALRISQVYSKEYILELYLNTVFYGNMSYGLEAAARTYYGKSLADLDLAELTMILGIPKAPTRYNPLLYPDTAKERQQEVLRVLLEAGHITSEQYEYALVEELQYAHPSVSIRAPHFVYFVLEQLQERYGEDGVYFGNLEVTTTLDLGLYEDIQDILEKRIALLAPYNVSNGAVVVLDNKTGAVVSFNGSRDYFDEESDGAVSVPFSYRQPGSTLKPFLYLMAFEQGDVPATPVADVEQRFFTEEGNPYVPQNYDSSVHGLVSMREALANSYNIPAVSLVHRLGVAPVVQMFRTLGVDILGGDNPDGLGLAIALGDGEVQLYDLVNAYRVLANYGLYSEAHSIEQVDDTSWSHVSRQSQVFDPEEVYLVTHVLSDNDARLAEFGEENFLKLPFPVAAKTGTTRNFRDNWVIGYSPRYTVGVWVGNADGSSMRDVSGITGAGPVFYDVMNRLHKGQQELRFYVPDTIRSQEVCRVSGLLPSEFCQERGVEVFPVDRLPTQQDSMWRVKEGGGYEIAYPPAVAAWALSQGLAVQDELGAQECILSPRNHDVFQIVSDRPRQDQMITLRGCRSDMEWVLNGRSLGAGREVRWQLEFGSYELQGRYGEQVETLRFEVQ